MTTSSKLLTGGLFKSSSIYIFTGLLNAVTPFLLIPFLTREFSNEDYGIVAMFTLSVNFLIPFIGLSVHGSITKRFFNNQGFDFKKYVGNAFVILLGSSTLILILFFFFSDQVFQVLSVPGKWSFLIIGVCLTQFINVILLTIWQVNERALNYSIFQILLSISNLILTVVLVFFVNLGWEGRALAWFISNLFFSIISIIILLKSKLILIQFDVSYIRDALEFSLPLIPHTIGAMLIGLSSRLIVNNLLGVEAVGIFTVSFQISSILGLVMSAFNNAFVPWLFKKLKKNQTDIKRKLVVLTYKLMVLMVLSPIASYVIISFTFEFLIGPKFYESIEYIPFLLAGFAFNGLYYLVTNYIFYAEATKYLAYTTLLTGLISIPMCYFFTMYFGIKGTSISVLLSYFILFSLTWVVSDKIYPMPWFSFSKSLVR